MVRVHVAPTPALPAELLHEFRQLLDVAFQGEFSDDDWEHCVGGTHAWVSEGNRVLAHGSLVTRNLVVGGLSLLVGYVEAVATLPQAQRQGHGSAVMRRLTDLISANFMLGVLSTGESGFYRRLGWETWRGPTAVSDPTRGPVLTPDDDGGIMVFRTPTSPALDLDTAIVADWRSGDVW